MSDTFEAGRLMLHGSERSYLHLTEFQRVGVAFPMVPFNAISVRRVFASKIFSVQVGIVTLFVPPGTFEFLCTIF